MELRQIHQFLALAETLNFREAAERLHMSQPPLSVSIRKLEEEIGLPLFERTTRQVSLTEAGEAVLPELRKALLHVQQARRYALEAGAGERGQLTLGSVGSATLSLIPRLIPEFRRRYPGVALELRELPSSGVLELVENGRADIGLVRFPLPQPTALTLIPLVWEPMMLVVPQDSALALSGRTRVHLAEVADQPLIDYPHTEGLHYVLLQLCQAAGFVPQLTHSTTQVQAAISLVACGLGVALVPALHARNSSAPVCFLELETPHQERTVALALVYNPENQGRVVRQFRDVAMELMQVQSDAMV
ncbi:MAG: Hca operon transcriptional activator HcaR [Stenotrophomonas maltophilia]|nr:MAG: Hca operon transcriptional activator HcaR [Stenotrophomonas maltophilia]